jgi:hypothetical protein
MKPTDKTVLDPLHIPNNICDITLPIPVGTTDQMEFHRHLNCVLNYAANANDETRSWLLGRLTLWLITNQNDLLNPGFNMDAVIRRLAYLAMYPNSGDLVKRVQRDILMTGVVKIPEQFLGLVEHNGMVYSLWFGDGNIYVMVNAKGAVITTYRMGGQLPGHYTLVLAVRLAQISGYIEVV